MAEHPLLIFPEPSLAERAKRSGGGGKFRLPEAQRQAGRLTPQFQRLQQAMDRQRIALQGNSFGLQPEQALVIETIGPIQDFVNAVQKVEGLEWLGEFELDDIPPEHGFEDAKDPEKQLKGRLILIMTDQRALQEMQNLFTNWKRDKTISFPHGLAPLKHAFTHLHTIRPWDAGDRIRDTGIVEDWKDRIAHGQEVVPFEAELWFRNNPDRQQQAQTYFSSVVDSLGGSADVAKVMVCTDQRATVLGVGKLDDGEGHEFLLPLPPSLSAITEKRRLTITLAWITPVNSRHQSYRIAHLWFNPKNNLAPSRMEADHRAVQRGAVQHEVLEGAKAVDFQDGDTITIKVSCRADAGDIPEPIRYSLAVTLEVAEGIDIPIYQEVKDRLRVPVPVQSGGRV